jgi:ribosomal protein S18 acetylase RimI-like enzyme
MKLGAKSNRVEERAEQRLRGEPLERADAHRHYWAGDERVDRDDRGGDKRNVREHPDPPRVAVIRYDWGMEQRGNQGEDAEEANFTVRPGRRDDAAAAAHLWVQSAEEHTVYDPVYATAPDAEKVMRRFLADLSSSSHSYLFVAERNGEVVGFLSGELREGSPAFKPKTWAAVEDVYVVPEHRSLGIGHALFEECRKWAEQKGADGISLQVAAGNTRARKFYEELGFHEVSVYQVKEFE